MDYLFTKTPSVYPHMVTPALELAGVMPHVDPCHMFIECWSMLGTGVGWIFVDS